MFAQQILKWYAKNGRDLPWRKTTDPYAILVSEIMLQQTQVPRVIEKYNQWLQLFPDWQTLADAPQEDVLRAWLGLGYNSRALRLQKLAQHVAEHGLPKTEEELKKLPGIGPYTAGALMVFAFNKPGECMDVNIERIMRRYFHKNNPTRKELLVTFMKSFPQQASDYGNALMDFGSLICTNTSPDCDACPIRESCLTKGEHPSEATIREKRKQGTFKHSNRWWRGQVLKLLNMKGALTEPEVRKLLNCEEASFEKALHGLVADGLVKKEKELLRL